MTLKIERNSDGRRTLIRLIGRAMRFWGLVLGTYARGCYDGKKRD
jgi:hypothetical protein